MAPSLQSLPTELICTIFEHLLPADDFYIPKSVFENRGEHWCTTVLNIAQTCQQLCDIAIPILNSRYEEQLLNPPTGLIDSIDSRPALQKQLKRIFIEGDDHDNFPEFEYLPGREICYRKWRKEASLKEVEFNPNEISVVAQLELWRVVTEAPNLETLHVESEWAINEQFGPSTPLWLRPLLSAYPDERGSLMRYEKLHTFRLHLQGAQRDPVTPLFGLRGLRHLEIHDFGQRGEPADHPIGPSESGVRTLVLKGVDVRASLVTQWLTCCKALVELERSQDNEDRSGFLQDGLQWSFEIAKSLK